MGEIKSTLDLVMEKTRGMTLSDEQWQNRRVEEERERGQGLARSYLEGRIDVSPLEAGGGGSEAVRRAAVRELLAHLLPEADMDRIFTGLARLTGHTSEEPLKKARDLALRCGEERKAIMDGLVEAARVALARAGISGSAVRPCIEASADGRETADSLREKHKAAFASLAEALTTSMAAEPEDRTSLPPTVERDPGKDCVGG